MAICQNPNCGKEIPEGMNYCGEDCVRRHIETKKEEKTSENSNNLALDIQLSTKLTNTQWQRGLAWRQEKIEAIAEARHRGIGEKEIFKQLKRSGLTDQTARKIMDDAHYCE